MPVFTETDIVLEGIGALLTPPPDTAARYGARRRRRARLAAHAR